MTASIRPGLLACLGWAFAVLPAGQCFAGEDPPRSTAERRLVVRPAAKTDSQVFVVAEIKGMVPPGAYALKRDDQSAVSPAEVFDHAGKTYIAFVLDPIQSDSTVSFVLTGTAASSEGRAIAADRAQGPEVPIRVGGQPMTTYIAGNGPKPYYYPVIGPTGVSFTRAYPMNKNVAGEDKDHPHQRSFWFTHGNVNGYDFWASDPENKPNPQFGSIKETSRSIVHNGHRAAVLRTTDDWLGLYGRKVCEDERIVGFYGLGENRVIDFDITLKATAGPVTFGDTKEGMFGLRLESSMDVKKKQGGKITNAEGITDVAAWGKASPWVDYTGPVEGQTVGVAVLNHPDSFRFPTTWHVRDYGLFAANPFGWKDFGMKKSGEYTLPKGESIRFRYRVVLHKGDTPSAHVPDAFQAYAHPPRVELEGR